ncbi:hypothetical protein DWV78_16060, partial [Agathobacter rectalis]
KTEKDPYLKYIDGSYDVYIKKPDGWGDKINCYAYVDEKTNNGEWPGVEMKYLGEGVYAYNLPDDFKTASVIFNDGVSQYPAAQQAGLEFTKGQSMAYINGSWTKVEKKADDIKITFSADTVSAKVGSEVKLTAQASGGSGNYTYKFIVSDNSGNWYKIRDYARSNTCTWRPGAAGNKTLYVDVKDSAGAYKRAALPIEVKKVNEKLSVKLAESPSGTAKVGSEVKLTAQASGGSGNYTYKFILSDNNGNWYKIRDYAKSNTCTWRPGAAGSKTLYVDVKDSEGAYQRVELPIQVTKQTEKLSVKLAASPSGTAKVGSEVKLTAQASGGSGNYTYKFIVSDNNGNWYKIRDYAKANTSTWIPGAAGNKTLYVDVKDSAGAYQRVELPIQVTKQAEKLSVKLTASPSKTVKVGSEVKLTAQATGGSGSYLYDFLVCSPDNNWYRLRDYEKTGTYLWVPKTVGNTMLYVDAVDGEGNYRRESLSILVTK